MEPVLQSANEPFGVSQAPEVSSTSCFSESFQPSACMTVELGLNQRQGLAASGRAENLLLAPVGGVAAVEYVPEELNWLWYERVGAPLSGSPNGLVGQFRAAVGREVGRVSVPAVGVESSTPDAL